ncbi:hypothetical protein Hanom_Chr12g01127451 [Helianthus anomalus]
MIHNSQPNYVYKPLDFFSPITNPKTGFHLFHTSMGFFRLVHFLCLYHHS